MIELFAIESDNKNFYQTSGPVDVVYLGKTYLSLRNEPIGHTEINESAVSEKTSVSVTVSMSNPLAVEYFGKYLERPVVLTLFQQDGTGTDVAWKGRLLATKQDGPTGCALVFGSVFSALQHPGLREFYQYTDNHVMYSAQSGVNMEDFAVPARVQSLTGTDLILTTDPGKPAGWFDAGIAKGPDGTLRTISTQSGVNISLIHPWRQVASGDALTLYPGYDGTFEQCLDKFKAWEDFGGFPWVPGRNPFRQGLD